MNNKEMVEKILNKKFKKAVFSGYDSADVDAYFDTVIEYLKNNDKMVQLYVDDLANLKKTIKQLQTDKQTLEKENARLAEEVKEYEEEGYGSGNLLLRQRSQQKK